VTPASQEADSEGLWWFEFSLGRKGSETHLQKEKKKPGAVMHTCDPSYLEGDS
jgi:hypothetical protein